MLQRDPCLTGLLLFCKISGLFRVGLKGDGFVHVYFFKQ